MLWEDGKIASVKMLVAESECCHEVDVTERVRSKQEGVESKVSGNNTARVPGWPPLDRKEGLETPGSVSTEGS